MEEQCIHTWSKSVTNRVPTKFLDVQIFCTTNHTTFDHQNVSELVSYGLTQGEKYILCESVSLHQLSRSLHFSSRLELFWIFQNLEICIRLFDIGCTRKV